MIFEGYRILLVLRIILVQTEGRQVDQTGAQNKKARSEEQSIKPPAGGQSSC